MSKPTLAVLFGQPDHLSTSFQTRQLIGALEEWFDPEPLHVASTKNKWVRSFHRIKSNYVIPFVTQPETDYVFYGNDGIADLSRWRAQKILYWYDAPEDWSKKRPRRSQLSNWLRYRNVITADHVFAVSAAQVEVAKRLRPQHPSSVSYLPVGVDCRVFDPAKADADRVRKKFHLPAKTIIGYLGYLGIVGGRFAGQALMEIAAGLLQQHNVHFFIVGFGPALDLFRHRVNDQGLGNQFTFTGYVSDELVPDCLAAMDICVDTLERGFHSEARSETKLKQYMAMGRACVATAIGENCVDLDQGSCGVLVGSNIESLTEGVATLCREPELRIRLGQAARQRAIAVYDWPVLASRLVSDLGLPSQFKSVPRPEGRANELVN
jgi:glycosyltransferase involved in cell wall biosynthesis